ncbi:hypothetical protein QBC39DRAFT_125502 [Podospora conica]|nr:hypothetical protein QBC39DRAFT_125502 [Schizothecium conicum]
MPAAMEDGTANPQPSISSYETFIERIREAAANEYGPSYRALQNYSTEAHASRSVIGPSGPGADLLARPRSPEPQDFTAGWPEPDSNFIGTISEELDIPRSCRLCHANADVHPASLLMCAGCGPAHSPVHKSCLRDSSRHRLLGPGQQPRPRRGKCEEVPFKEYAYLSWLLDSQYRQEDSDSLHLDDLRTTWFGVPHDQKASSPKLFVWPRLQAILNNAPDHLQYQFPSLVSFVGDTGSGKSTIIKAMIRMSAPKSHGRYQVPVPGTDQDQFTSTSSDVHLYADPWTVSTEVPIVMADCEGLFGTSTPVSRRIVSDEYRKQPSYAPPLLARGMDNMVRDHLKKASMEVSLAWARVDHPRPLSPRVDLPSDAPEFDPRHSGTWSDISDAPSKASSAEPLGFVQANSRDLITKSLYPRLLYAFSDVVCFVTHNTRASQDIMWKLFEWSQDGLERTFNQRVRPGLIIIVNKNTPQYDYMLPNVDDTTELFLTSVESSSKFQEYKQKWRSRQRKVNTAADLIRCYYDDFRVISLPLHDDMPSTASRVSNQIKRLYHEIRTLSESIHSRRNAHDLNMDVATFTSYFERSIEILARDHTSSLDFHPLSEDDSPLPTKFSEHMALVLGKMAKLGRSRASGTGKGELQMIKDMVPFLACSILCQKARNQHQETAELQELLVDEACRGLERFRKKFWRCEAVSDGSRCQNYWESHDKGHQFECAPDDDQIPRKMTLGGSRARQPSRAPKVHLVNGQHECSYGSYAGEFRDALWDAIRIYRGSDIRSRMTKFANQLDLSRLQNQRTCLACLSNCPTNVLPCMQRQHAICEDCIRWYTGPSESAGCVLSIDSCPLGCQFRVKFPWNIRVKPKEAQSRILVLDGGGIRGVVELVILAQLMEQIPFEIPIQHLFDLVIGTSTGGIIALGIFEMGWTPKRAIDEFRNLARQAFTKKLPLRVPIIKYIAEYFYTSQYESIGIESALQSAFGPHAYLFGQAKKTSTHDRGDDVKVGVVSCLKGRDQPCLIANYNRNPGSNSADCFQREDDQRNDFKIWQAARATSAAHTYFEPYRHRPTSKVYVDGAIVRNNPVRVALEEEKRIWGPDVRPDIVVSIGSGICIDEHGRIQRHRRSGGGLKMLLPPRLRKMVDTGIDMVASTLDCQREWDEVVKLHPQLEKRFHRLDVGIFDNKLPALDDVDKMKELEELSRAYLAKNSETGRRDFNASTGSAHTHLQTVARELLASLFYFSDAAALQENSDYTKRVTGVIHCRLPLSTGAQELVRCVRFRLRSWKVPRSRNGPEDYPLARDIVVVRGRDGRRFNRSTLSTCVYFDIQPGPWARTIEACFPTSRESTWPLWATISGF